MSDTPVGGDRDAVAEALKRLDGAIAYEDDHIRTAERGPYVGDIRILLFRVKELEAALAKFRPSGFIHILSTPEVPRA